MHPLRTLFVGLGPLSIAASSAFALGEEATLDGGHGFVVRVNEQGLMTSVPAMGVFPDLGFQVRIGAGFHEWFGVDYMDGAAKYSGAGTGGSPDWLRRTPVQPVRFTHDAKKITSVVALTDLLITHEFSFEPITGKLVVAIEFENTGKNMVIVMYTREWQVPNTNGRTFPPEVVPMLPTPPSDVWRVALMPNNIAPGMRQGLALSFDVEHFTPGAVDVPMKLWTSKKYKNGINFGDAAGISFGDYDHDGWIDVYADTAANLWRNELGVDWTMVNNLNGEIGNNRFRYGAALADYDNDQLLDIGTEPRSSSDSCMHLLHNLGSDQFIDVADDSSIVDDQPCSSDSETMCAADTDGDGNLDWFLPTYPPFVGTGSPGNWFLHNLGPIGNNGAYIFHEASAEAGLDNPDGVNRPEGAEFCDVDHDGDLDLYSNGTLYRNIVTTVGTPLFEPMTKDGSGIILSWVLDEGAGFLDYDLDGDMDLLIGFCDAKYGLRMFENRGDGTYFITSTSFFDSFNTGLCFGLSWEDWDNDGDIDVTSGSVFRRNQWVETGERHYTVATHSLDGGKIANATPAWGDFDHDGDLDAAIGSVGAGWLFENTSYDATTPMDQRRYVRVRPVRDSDVHDDGLETEQGAQVTVRANGDSDDGFIRTKTVTVSGGYLNQPEYTTRFALPADPDPADPLVDLTFNVTVDFKNPVGLGYTRIDRHVNPILGDVGLANLDDREIVVYRSGRVRLNGCDFFPSKPVLPLLTTTNGLAQAPLDSEFARPVLSPSSDWFVGIEVSTAGAPAPQWVEELILDGQLDLGSDCGDGAVNLLAWDVTNPAAPVLVSGGDQFRDTQPRNDRTHFPFDVVLAPDRLFRIVAQVTKLRDSPIAGPVVTGAITTNGGLSFQDTAPCTGTGAAAAALDPSRVYLALRFRDKTHSAWFNAGHALAGQNGEPKLVGRSDLDAGSRTQIELTNGASSAPLWVVFGGASACLEFAGGSIVPSLDLILSGLSTDAKGHWVMEGAWPDGVPGGTTFWCQAFLLDAAAPKGISMSNAIGGTTPY